MDTEIIYSEQLRESILKAEADRINGGRLYSIEEAMEMLEKIYSSDNAEYNFSISHNYN